MKRTPHILRWSNRIGWALFALSPCAMALWVFLWPAAVGGAPDDPIVHWGGIGTLVCFLASLVALLTVRGSRLRPYQDLLTKRRGCKPPRT
ncbi:MAG: DUF2975 domain-containing protein [Planctomycetota bacterium]